MPDSVLRVVVCGGGETGAASMFSRLLPGPDETASRPIIMSETDDVQTRRTI